ncbi:YggS family pyridoxal phosphate-dependent enzyme [uncultured Mobiluncus sp.]|uniref:YggS family pyridoxal phosphate-dependent enzyme n=1 Tax=uncultured Mobiluncus sp. TaxID=293425 RepID=UPI0027D965BD|nr:YggS family pyridoxal phosphate-dependent enzyme [uncultured Mobiluncus sp.]
MIGFSQRLQALSQRVAAAAAAAGRDGESIRILPVSKTHPVADLREALATGVSEFGENKPQELAAKAAELGANLGLGADGNEASPRWIQIGNLQRNKAKLIVANGAELQSLDSAKLAQTLNRLLDQAGRTLEVMIEVNTSGEDAKHGIAPEETLELARLVIDQPRLHLIGLMTVAAHVDQVGERGVFEMFSQLAGLREAVSGLPGGEDCRELSMGMSGDFELAIAAGSTCVRVGSALFGPRDYAQKPVQ